MFHGEPSGNAHSAGDFHLTGILSELKRRNVIRRVAQCLSLPE